MFTREGAIRWFHDEAAADPRRARRPAVLAGDHVRHHRRNASSEALARETEDRYRTLVEQLPAIVYSEDVTGDGLQVVYINSRVEELLGIEPEEWVADPSRAGRPRSTRTTSQTVDGDERRESEQPASRSPSSTA